VTYLDYDVLELNYNRIAGIEERLRRKFVLLDPKTGKRTPDEQAPAPAGVRPFTWTAIGRPEITVMREFLAARKGRAVPFWLPSYQWDLELSEDALEDQSILSIRWVRYTQQMFGTTGARRHIAIWTLGDDTSMDYYRIDDADDPLNYTTESITIDPVAVRDYPKETTVISFLKLCRLDSDRVGISYPNDRVADATIMCRELPLEAPTEGS